MNNKNISTINENLLPKLKTSSIFYIFAILIVFLIIMMFMIIYDVSPLVKKPKSIEQTISDTFIILFSSLLIVGTSILFLPYLNEFKALLEQIGSVTYVILYTIFAILFYTITPKDILKDYSYIINPAILGLGAFSFYKGTIENYVQKFNINYERIKSLIMLFCLIALVVTFNNVNSGELSSKYFDYSFFLTIILAVFALLYVIILMTLPGEQDDTKTGLLSNFSSFGLYGSILFILFLITTTILILTNKDSLFDNKEKTSSIMIILLIICILWTTLLSINSFSDFTNNIGEASKLGIFQNSLSFLFGIAISGLFIFWITNTIEKQISDSSISSFILNALLVIVILGLVYKIIDVIFPIGNARKNALFSIILNSLLYIPCLVSNGFDFIGKLVAGEYNAANVGSFMMLGVAIGLIIAYIKIPTLFNYVSTQGGKQLVNKPVYTDTEYNLGNYQELNGSEQFDYQYAISCWVYIEAVGPNTNASYNKFTSLLNFGDKPNILYNGKTHTLMITMQQKNLKEVTKNKLIDFDENGNRIIYIDKNFLLQKWNNIIINYNGGTLDIFLNGTLVKSSIEVVPYYTFDKLTIGENDGIKGGICNVVYFRRALTSQNVFFLYNTVKDKTVPVLNDSNDTIMVENNNNQTFSSTKKVVEEGN